MKATFGKGALDGDHAIIVTSAKGDGLRPGGKGSAKRKRVLSDEIDKLSHGYFGNPGNRDYFLDQNRLDSDELIQMKPVFAGCDAHDFDALEKGLGRHVAESDQAQHITWIKADLSFEGLQQTLAEPSARVMISPLEPDLKNPYQYISEVRFSGSDQFPQLIQFNRNLNSVIGSRSSGKSALLAYIAHAVDREETLRVQQQSSELIESELGPAAGISWSDVTDVKCDVYWGDGEQHPGRVVYIPQNSLNRISEKPTEITAKIGPSLFRMYPRFQIDFDQAISSIKFINQTIGSGVKSWFALEAKVAKLSQEILDLGDQRAIQREMEGLNEKISELKTTQNLSETELEEYQGVTSWMGAIDQRLTKLDAEDQQLSFFTEPDPANAEVFRTIAESIEVNISLSSAFDQLPQSLLSSLDELVESAKNGLVDALGLLLADYRQEIGKEQVRLASELGAIVVNYAPLIQKHQSNEQLETLISNFQAQEEALKAISNLNRERSSARTQQRKHVEAIKSLLRDRETEIVRLEDNFHAQQRKVDELVLEIQCQQDTDAIERLSQQFKKNESGDYVLMEQQLVDLQRAHDNPGDFLKQLSSGKQKLNRRVKSETVAIETLTQTKEIRFAAALDGDVIGGFGRSTMTPGKQALFALTLILNESNELWPLLIDQPEDDLDSRSIYDTIVPYLSDRKKSRQIIMVSHNANLVVGADSEEVIVANRHGDDRKNAGGRTFDYLSGSLEHSLRDMENPIVLEKFGVREHTCEVLDGGEEAFQKRMDKYKISEAYAPH
jgi:hypothetical protein